MAGGTSTFLGGARSPIQTTIGSHVIGTIQQSGTSTLSSGAIAATSDVRIVMIQVETETQVEVVVTLDDASTVTHRIFGGSYSLELEYNQSPITLITVEELDNTATRAVINWVNKRL